MATYRNGYTNGGNAPSKNIHHTVTALNRWSVANKQLPSMRTIPVRKSYTYPYLAYDKIKAIHVYDFDNTRKFQPPRPTGDVF